MKKRKILSVRNLKKYYPLPKRSLFSKGRPYLRANDGVDLDIYEGETYGLVGESGCGKSTLGRTVLRLLPPTSGEVLYYGADGEAIDLTKVSGKQLRALRKELQIIFQDPYSSLNPKMTVGQIIEEGVATHGFYEKGSAEMQKYLLETMEKCGLQGYMAGRYPHQFSGGQRQRVCIARALAVRPKFVVCDECVSALDLSVQSQILNLLSELKKKEGLTYLFISHDLSVVRYISDEIGVMYLGKIVEWGGAEEVFDNASHPYTQALLRAIPSIEGKREWAPSAVDEGRAVEGGCPYFPRCERAKEDCRRIPAPLVEVNEGHFVRCRLVDGRICEEEEGWS